jgi:hypothetical protein
LATGKKQRAGDCVAASRTGRRFTAGVESKLQFNCGIIAFTVIGGKAVFCGRGGFNFGDEALAMSLEGDSKQFSLVSGQSPIRINGWFAEPRINPISGELLVRGAAGRHAGGAAS